jgi:hypothetical protein
MSKLKEWIDIEKVVEEEYGSNYQYGFDPIEASNNFDYYEIKSLLAMSIAEQIGISYSPNIGGYDGFSVSWTNRDSKEHVRKRLNKLFLAEKLYEKLANAPEIKEIETDARKRLTSLVEDFLRGLKCQRKNQE